MGVCQRSCLISSASCWSIVVHCSRDEELDRFLLSLIAQREPKDWEALLRPSGGSLGLISGEAKTAVGWLDKPEIACREAATAAWTKGADIVVLGHTHLKDKVERRSKRYFNPGSWTRYIYPQAIPQLTAELLKDETRFPFDLSYVEIDRDASGRLAGKLYSFEQSPGR